MGRQLRIWWPKQHLLTEPSPLDILFGWFVSSSPASLDIVVALTVKETLLPRSSLDLEEILRITNEEMPVCLHGKSMFSMLGLYAAGLGTDSNALMLGVEDNLESSSYINDTDYDRLGLTSKKKGNQNFPCGCYRIGKSSEPYRQVAVGNDCWIQLTLSSLPQSNGENFWIPKVHHIHWKRLVVYRCDVHVIIYETPAHGAHHFSLSYSHERDLLSVAKKPNWVKELHLKRPPIDMSTVILAINCAKAAASISCSKTHFGPEQSFSLSSLHYMICAFMWHVVAVSAASLSTLSYVIIQHFHFVASFGSQSWMYKMTLKVFDAAHSNIKVRSSQILYWPIFLQNGGIRSQSCVEYAEKAALRKHSMWSNVVVDILLGNLIGLTLLFHSKSVGMWFLSFTEDVNNHLRTGSVWLMGVPAGFKLNTELAAILGTTSLNVIQIWSTLSLLMGFFLTYIVRGIAIVGMLFGATVCAALIIDMTAAASLHISTLHWLVALLYSSQTQALAALWRLFRGQKWNPLRLRLDSYDYTVEQHVVGSLLFTPLLLLLPTTSVFYLFFTIMNTTIRSLHILIEGLISIIHATPYMKILLWLVRPTRFPAGIWFEIASCKYNTVHFAKEFFCDGSGVYLDSKNSQDQNVECAKSSTAMVSFLHSRLPSIGQIILPHYKTVFTGIRGSLAESAYGILTGKRISYSLGIHRPTSLPWMHIPVTEYWRLCHQSVLSQMEDHRFSSFR